MNKNNWLIPLFIAAVIALLAALKITTWDIAIYPIAVLIFTGLLTWIILRIRESKQR